MCEDYYMEANLLRRSIRAAEKHGHETRDPVVFTRISDAVSFSIAVREQYPSRAIKSIPGGWVVEGRSSGPLLDESGVEVEGTSAYTLGSDGLTALRGRGI